MPTKKETHQQGIERIKGFIQGYADRLFSGSLERAFLFWASGLHLDQADDPPTDDELLGNITDGKDDLELDAYFVDESANAIYLFQSKFRTLPANLAQKDPLNFLDVPTKLTSPQILAANTNEKILELAPTFRQHILNGYGLQLRLVTTLRATTPIRARAQKWADEPLALDIGGERVDVPHSVVVSDLEDLLTAAGSLSEIRNIVVDLKMDGMKWHYAPAGQFKCLVSTISAEELAKIFHMFRYAIFRHNPRGPLGSVSVNKKIRDTLVDSEKRVWFHLMNNGLSAVCDSFTSPVETNGGFVTTVQDFQIVNGCQTTYIIWDYSRKGVSLVGTQVALKLVEGAAVRSFISAASNAQSQMKDWDFLFNDPMQVRLQRDFEKLTPPIFFELRRGEYKYIAKTDVERVTVKDIAQAVWAFLGFPGEAKDRLRDIPRSRETKTGAYHQVFPPEVQAEYLRLPWLVYERVKQEWENYYQEYQVRGDYREHGRLHVLWLIGRGLTKALGVPGYQQVSPALARELANKIDNWFPILHSVAVDTISDVVNIENKVAARTGQAMSLRQLFRSSTDYPTFAEQHDENLTKRFTELKKSVAVA